MVKKAFWKNSFRAIKDNLSRFFSMISIVMLATGVITGLLVTAPNMQNSMTDQFINDNLYDFNLVSSIGFDNDSIKILEESNYFKDVEKANIFDQKAIVNDLIAINTILYEINLTDQKINKLNIIEKGNIPRSNNEILVQQQENLPFKIGDFVEINNKRFTISGIVKSSVYFSKEPERAITTNNTVDAIFYKNFDDDSQFSNIFLTFDKDKNLNQFSKKYTNLVEDKKNILEQLMPTILQERLNNLNINIDYNYYILDRSTNASYITYKSFVNNVSTITQIFPVFFLVVSILVVLTTLTRMIEEERQEIGIARSLGYHKIDIYGKYLVYASLVLILGVGIGYAAGFRLIPVIVNSAFNSTFYTATLNLKIFSLSNIIYIIIIVISILLTALITIGTTLKNNCASLLLPKPPKYGKRIFLEKIGFIWNKLKFKYKSTLRNLFRYPRNFIMTILGIAGSLALIFTGLALRNSLTAITTKQFNEIYKYDYNVIVSKQLSDDYINYLNQHYNNNYIITEQFNDFLITKNTNETFYITVVVVDDDLAPFINLKPRRKNQTITLNNEGVIVTEQIAQYLKLNIDDTFNLVNSEDIKINGITENYINNYIYMTKEYFNNHFTDQRLSYNILIKDKNYNKEDVIKNFLQLDDFSKVNFIADDIKQNKKLLNQINILSIVIVLSAGFLAVIIIYNLTNVNISEREKELSTLKVLGYKNKEVSSYIFREINIMTVIGIILGIPLGYLLNYYIITNVDAPNLMLGRTIHYSTFLISIALIIVFVIIVQIIMNAKIKKVDMIGALKEL